MEGVALETLAFQVLQAKNVDIFIFLGDNFVDFLTEPEQNTCGYFNIFRWNTHGVVKRITLKCCQDQGGTCSEIQSKGKPIKEERSHE